ncbi:hypothetical protein JCM5296_003181 [Sporobolomyces johnsonii]
MSSRGSPIPRHAFEPPTSPFQPVLPSSSSRRPVVRRPTAPPSLPSPSSGRTPTLFGEVGKEHELDDFDVLSVLSGSSWGGGGGGADDPESDDGAFLPRMRDLRVGRPVVRKRALVVPKEVQEGEATGKDDEPKATIEGEEYVQPRTASLISVTADMADLSASESSAPPTDKNAGEKDSPSQEATDVPDGETAATTNQEKIQS